MRHRVDSSRVGAVVLVVLLLAVVLVAGCGGPFPQSTLRPRSDVGIQIDDLFRSIFWWAVGVFVVVEGLLVYAVFRFRERPGDERPKPVHGNTRLEIAWTLAPAVILVLIAVPTIRTIFNVDDPPKGPAMDISVTAHQWWWEFHYPDLGVVTANEIHVPVGKTVELKLQSADVIHSFWIPAMDGKRDVIPNHTNQLWFTADTTGIFPGQCAEFCGESHALMGMRLVAQSPEAFQAWVDSMKRPAVEPTSDLAVAGKKVFMSNACIGCHTIDGTVAQGKIGPNLTHVGSRRTIAAGVLKNTPEDIATWIADPQAVKPGALMPKLPLSGAQRKQLAAYLSSLK